jgi:hypothetical protein
MTRRGWRYPPRASSLARSSARWIGEEYRPEPTSWSCGCRARKRFAARAYVFAERAYVFAERAYVFAEIVSGTDNTPVSGEKEPCIAIKPRLYRAHPPCEAVIPIDRYRAEVRTDLRVAHGWISGRLTRLDEWPTTGRR